MPLEENVDLVMDKPAIEKAKREASRAGSEIGSNLGWNVVKGLAAAVTGFNILGNFITQWVNRIARATIDFARHTLDLGKAAEETQSKFEQVFGPTAAARVQAFLDGFSHRAGLTNAAAQEITATLGSMRIAMGDNVDQAGDFAIKVVKLAGDLTSFNNTVGGIDATLVKLRAGLIGEYEPLRTMGVFLTEDRVKAEALRMGIAKTGETLTAQQKIQARYAIILHDTERATGDLDRTQNSTTNRTRFLSASFQDLQTRMGTLFLPILGAVVDKMVQWMPTIEKVTLALTNLSVNGIRVAYNALFMLKDVLVALLLPVGGLVDALGYLVDGFALVDQATAKLSRDQETIDQLNRRSAALKAQADAMHKLGLSIRAMVDAAGSDFNTRMDKVLNLKSPALDKNKWLWKPPPGQGPQTHINTAEEIKAMEAALLSFQGVLASTANTAAAAVLQQMRAIEKKFKELTGTIPQEVKDAFHAAMTALENEAAMMSLGENIARQFGDIAAQVVEGMGSEALQNVVSQIDDLRAEAQKLIAVMPGATDDPTLKTKEQIALEAQINAMIAKRNELVDQLAAARERENLTVQGEADTDADRIKQHEIRLGLIQAQGDAIAKAAGMALDLANAFGLVDDNITQVLNDLVQVGVNISAFVEQFKTFKAGLKDENGNPAVSLADLLGSAVPIVGGISSAIKGISGVFGESPEAKALREAIRKNTERLHELHDAMENVRITLTGQRFGGVGTGLGNVLAGGQGRGKAVGLGEVAMGTFEDLGKLDAALRRAGTSLKDVQQVADDLGIDISQHTVKQFQQLKQAVDDFDLTKFTQTFEGQSELLDRRARLFKNEDALDQLNLLVGEMHKVGIGSEYLAKQFEGLDLRSKSGLEEARKRMEQAFKDFPNLTAEQLGGLTRDQYLDTLQHAADLIDQGLTDLAQQAIEAATKARQSMIDAEQEQVDAMHEALRQADISDLIAKAQNLGETVNQAIVAFQQAEAIAQQQLLTDPLGEDSPLYQEYKRRAEEKFREAQAAVDQALKAQAGQTEAGFTVRKEVTQVTGSRMVGEMVTGNALHREGNKLLVEIRDILADGWTSGQNGEGGQGTVIMMDGRVVGQLVSRDQADQYQQQAIKSGNARIG
jgi:tetratricopeptide (TPR) repeat protein